MKPKRLTKEEIVQRLNEIRETLATREISTLRQAKDAMQSAWIKVYSLKCCIEENE